MSKNSIAVLSSGGLDSAILLDYYSKRFQSVHPIYVRNGHQWEESELFWLKRFLKQYSKTKPLAILDLSTKDLYENHWSITGKKVPNAKSNDTEVYLPGKNLLLIAKASVFCALKKIPHLALGPLKSNPFPDAKPQFFRAMERSVKLGFQLDLKIHTPFLKYSKKEVMRLGQELPLHLTFSCISPKKLRHCGKCNKCAERKRAFRLAKLFDSTKYAN